MASREQTDSSSSDEEELAGELGIHCELPSGSERELIEHYFYKGISYRQITSLLEKHHNLIMDQRTLKRFLRGFKTISPLIFTLLIKFLEG